MSKRKSGKELSGPNTGIVPLLRSNAWYQRRITVLGFIAFCLVVLVYWFDSPSAFMRIQARRELDRFNYAGAMKWLERARWASSRDAGTELLAARVARRQGDVDSFQRHLQRARYLGAAAMDVRLEELLAIAQSGAIDVCEEELISHMVLPNAETDEISDAYANGLAAASRLEDAVSVLTAWGMDYPDDPRPYYRMGRLHEHSERWQEAESSYRAAVERNENYYPAWYAVGRTCAIALKVDEAIEAYTRCLDSNQPHAAMIQLAACYRSKGHASLAREKLAVVLKNDIDVILSSYKEFEESPEYFNAATQLADLLAEAGDYEQSIAWYRKSLFFNERDLTARYGLALTLRNLGESAAANREFERVSVARKALERANLLRDRIAKGDEHLQARLELGELLLKYESERMGLFWIRSILTFDPENELAHATLAGYYESKLPRGHLNDAAAAYHRSKASAKNQRFN